MAQVTECEEQNPDGWKIFNDLIASCLLVAVGAFGHYTSLYTWSEVRYIECPSLGFNDNGVDYGCHEVIVKKVLLQLNHIICDEVFGTITEAPLFLEYHVSQLMAHIYCWPIACLGDYIHLNKVSSHLVEFVLYLADFLLLNCLEQLPVDSHLVNIWSFDNFYFQDYNFNWESFYLQHF